ncbi:hypothetical protein DOY81_013229 [Sarcophaga bullata]|nr:hypothetical protein DOY81_013229 [Sarcophaga bullata]
MVVPDCCPEELSVTYNWWMVHDDRHSLYKACQYAWWLDCTDDQATRNNYGQYVRFFEEVIHNCSHLQDPIDSNNLRYTTVLYERYEDSNLPTITRDLVKNCNPLAEALEENFSVRRIYNYNINSRHNLRNNFMMLTSNITEVVNGLDKIRKNLRKFNCINDNLDINFTEDNKLIRHLLEDFYLSLFPHRSQFELSPEYRNRFQNWRDYVKWRRQQKAILTTVYILSILILAYLVRSICIHKAKFVSRYIQKL